MDVWRRDEEIDALYTSLFRELLTYMMEDPRNITFCTHLLFCAKNIERIGDHATNIAETVYYLVTGRVSAANGRRAIAPARSARTSSRADRTARRADEAAHPDRRGRGALDASPALQPRSGGLSRSKRVARGDEARSALREQRARPRPARLDAARPVRASSSAAASALRAETKPLPIIMLTARGEESDRVRGLDDRRRRLRRQAVLGARADGAGASGPAPRQAGRNRRRCCGRRPRARPRDAARAPRRQARFISARPSSACSNS